MKKMFTDSPAGANNAQDLVRGVEGSTDGRRGVEENQIERLGGGDKIDADEGRTEDGKSPGGSTWSTAKEARKFKATGLNEFTVPIPLRSLLPMSFVPMRFHAVSTWLCNLPVASSLNKCSTGPSAAEMVLTWIIVFQKRSMFNVRA